MDGKNFTAPLIRRFFSVPAALLGWTVVFLFLTGTAAAEELEVRVFPPSAELYYQGEKLAFRAGENGSRVYSLQAESRPGDDPLTFVFKAPGYYPARLLYHAESGGKKNYEIKLERFEDQSRLAPIGEYPTGGQPKSVRFLPGGRRIVVAQLKGPGLDVYYYDRGEAGSGQDGRRISIRKGKPLRLPPGNRRHFGFVETAVLAKRGELWVSQMTTDRVHILGLEDLDYRGSVDTGGHWSKVICPGPQERLVYVSNWVTKDISVIDPEQRRLVRTIGLEDVPRGIAVAPKGTYLYVCLYESGKIEKIAIDSGARPERRRGAKTAPSAGKGFERYPLYRPVFRRELTLELGPGAKRHIVLDPGGRFAYASDMHSGRIFRIDLSDDSVLRSRWIGWNLNTIEISSDGQYLFVSSRGKNNHDSYLLKGPEFGRVFVMDTETLELVDWIWGRNQPTGLDLSPDDRLLAFTDFLDDNLEIYDTSALFNQ
ncbi:MAG: hypothetical protein K9L68_03770 [Spirochaetales bacterium]|nr:hypothetical protein [Spirochaetales bacterium]MCF7937697.1 hypothetical protein [Spirochaetales bacterium]